VRAKDHKDDRAREEQRQQLDRLVTRHPLILCAVLDGWKILSIDPGPRDVRVYFQTVPRGQWMPGQHPFDMRILVFSTEDGTLLTPQEAIAMGLEEEFPSIRE
jgi:hypothetical protein